TLLGYFWRAADCPWISLWQDIQDGVPLARGLEFGTTGLHQPYPVLLATGRIFDRDLYRYFDAGESHTYRYAAFLVAVPADFRGVARIDRAGEVLVLHETGGTGRRLDVFVGSAF